MYQVLILQVAFKDYDGKMLGVSINLSITCIYSIVHLKEMFANAF